MRKLASLAVLACCLASAACDDATPAPRFRLLPPERTGIHFSNTITPTETHHFASDPFLYNGAGVAIGDVDGDGLPDIYLTGNMVSSRLYRNRGGMRFEDVTEQAGVGTDRWATGASMADIEGDGDLDLYVSVSGPAFSSPAQRANLLFINDGAGTFTESAAAWGLADTGFTTHAAFLDYDRDGHLDVFLLGNSPGEFGRGQMTQSRFGARPADPSGFDRLYRNQGDGTFRDVSEEAGLLRQLGYGLGVVVADLNADGWPDVYVSNDVTPADVLYVNNGDGTFSDRAAAWLGHTSAAGMGLDIADFTNDGWPDILQTDMMPEDLAARKRVGGIAAPHDLPSTRGGGAPQYSLNTLQWHRGVAPDGQAVFSEIARMAGVAYTDWSWAALFGDYDNDGLKDVLITNGYPKAVTDLDYQFNVHDGYRVGATAAQQEQIREILDTLPAYRVPNYVFRNEGDLRFTDRTREWGLSQPGFSYGAAWADLNGDGTLDLVVNNIDAPASVYENVAAAGGAEHYLRVRLNGEAPNRRGIGATLTLTAGGQKQYVYNSPFRGYMSSVEDRLHFGLGPRARVDSLEVTWPDGRSQLLTDIPADREITIDQRAAQPKPGSDPARARPGHAPFRRLDPDLGPSYRHRENEYRVDYSVQPLLPEQISRLGPPLAVADVNGDGLDDVFAGGAAGSPGTLFLQQPGGGFAEASAASPWTADAAHEDWGALFFDADGDGRPDLYVASGGYHPAAGSRLLQDRLYLNRGEGEFEKAADALPEMLTSTAAVRAADFTGDGRLDLFVGGRMTPRSYPTPTRSWLLRNDGGRFTDVTGDVAPELLEPGGMITDAVWLDFSGDGRPDLVTAGTWMPIRFFENGSGRLREVTEATGLPPLRGWWHALAAADLDGDGDADLAAGNEGLNGSYTTSPESPFGVYAADFDGNGTTDPVFVQEIDGTDYPFYGLALLGRVLDARAVKFPTFEAFSRASVRQLFGSAATRRALRYEADTFASVWLRNDGNGRFTAIELPAAAQISPVRAILTHDVDGDGNLDLLVAGNTFHTEANSARADAGKGLWLKGDGRGGLRAVSPAESGFLAPFDVRSLALVRARAGALVLVGNNGAALESFALRR